ncbi:DNA mismatch repair protein MutL [Haladaptatus litoreus]|uniref:DNA mismatch repair protein MutL n=1 Tax=Haladaptatus litoreus TaxID=553468 RepID=A0A1N6VUQ2_9EURY|nr:DNA mismatch repair endonuclease MutL [Haladaptatus litoreus]SIQ81603.1 DNA mismatch repair protein MutL [Haladaptatus litoreus]
MSDGELTIRALDEKTVQRIAAGEVVERPASVVKELVENSLDADAGRISVRIDGGGTEKIVIEDDGIGMSEDDVQLAVEEHTTSKIRDIDDLESGVATLGFRGEALYTIGAVARLTIRTKARGGEAGTELRLVGGDVEEIKPAGRPAGTTVEVTDLFFNTPAREKYLKTDSTEFSHVNRVVTQYALANPDVAFSLEHDGREVFSTTGQGDLQSAILSVYGREVATAMIAVGDERSEGDDERDTEDAERTELAVSGYVSHPETTRSTREYVATYVNGRYVRSSVVREAVLDAYGNQLAPDRYPFAVLFLSVPGDSVDVNVHPRKMEVRFGDEGTVRKAVRDSIENALLDDGLIRSAAPRGRSAPDETDVTPEVQSELGATTDERDFAAAVDKSTDESKSVNAEPSSTSRTVAESRERDSATANTANGRKTTAENETADANASDTNTDEPVVDANRTDTDANSSATDDEPRKSRNESRDEPSQSKSNRNTAEQMNRNPERKFRATTETETLTDAPDTSKPAEREFDRLPRMRVLGQLHDTYVVAETPDGLVLIDQHAADERVNYERLREKFAGDTTTQVLASPVELELTAAEAALFSEYDEALARLGFHAALTGERTVEVTTVPAVLSETLSPELLRDVLSEFVSADSDEHDRNSAAAVADALISDLACYPSITGNTSLHEGDVVSLLSALDDCDNPYACPHGRPVVIELGEAEIENRFERDYPGHAGRRAE